MLKTIEIDYFFRTPKSIPMLEEIISDEMEKVYALESSPRRTGRKLSYEEAKAQLEHIAPIADRVMGLGPAPMPRLEYIQAPRNRHYFVGGCSSLLFVPTEYFFSRQLN